MKKPCKKHFAHIIIRISEISIASTLFDDILKSLCTPRDLFPIQIMPSSVTVVFSPEDIFVKRVLEVRMNVDEMNKQFIR